MPAVLDIRQADDVRDVVHRAVQVLVEGGVVAFPTETVYGLAASAMHAAAVERLFAIKGRDSKQPLSLALRSLDAALDYVPGISPLGYRLARRCWPGPVTLVLDADHPDSLLHRLPPAVRAAVWPNGTVGVRVPAHDALREVLRLLTGPLALTSANKSGQPDATTAQQVVEAFRDTSEVNLVIDDGECRFGQPSSVVRVNCDGYRLLRAGVVGEEQLQRLAGRVVLFVCTGNTCRSPMAEALCRGLFAQRLGCSPDQLESRGLVVMSAGVAAYNGGGAAREAQEVMSRRGLGLESHQSQALTDQLVRYADHIITMTRAHRQAVLTHWPEAGDRTEVLCEAGDVSDPIGGSLDEYEQCADQIAEALGKWVERLLPRG